jgi:enamine deaminase RidA (YjgF/YER057c/UK114 family)
MAYPIAYDVEPQLHDRNRLTVFFRIILALPHLILVGGPVIAFGCAWGHHWGGNGILGVVAGIMAIISWFAILFASVHPRGLWDFARYFMSWRARVVAYAALLRDDYPPFGEGAYPVTYDAAYPDMPRDKWSVGLRIFYVIRTSSLFFVGIAWFITAVIAWFAILHRFVPGQPLPIRRRVSALAAAGRILPLLLMRDEYPPFSSEMSAARFMMIPRTHRSRRSRTIEVDGWVFLTGQMPTDPNNDGAPLSAGVEAQTRRVMDNLVLVLNGAGLGLEHVVAMRAFLTNFERDYGPMNEVYRSYFPASRLPARTCVGVTGLARNARRDRLHRAKALALAGSPTQRAMPPCPACAPRPRR